VLQIAYQEIQHKLIFYQSIFPSIFQRRPGAKMAK
jgi:hypothetical protein